MTGPPQGAGFGSQKKVADAEKAVKESEASKKHSIADTDYTATTVPSKASQS